MSNPRRWLRDCEGCGRAFQVVNDAKFREYADMMRREQDDTLTDADVAQNMIYCLGCAGEYDDSDLIRRPHYFRDLTADERAEVRKGYHDVITGSVRPSRNDTRAQLRDEARRMLASVIADGEELDGESMEGALWAIGRDLATARYLRSAHFHPTLGFRHN